MNTGEANESEAGNTECKKITKRGSKTAGIHRDTLTSRPILKNHIIVENKTGSKSKHHTKTTVIMVITKN